MLQDEHTDERRTISFHRKPSFHDNMMLAYKKTIKSDSSNKQKIIPENSNIC